MCAHLLTFYYVLDNENGVESDVPSVIKDVKNQPMEETKKVCFLHF